MTGSAITVSTLVGHRDANMAVTCLGSLANSSQQAIRFRIHDDGTLTSNDRRVLSERLPILDFIDREIANIKICKILQNYPACLRYRSTQVLALKLFDVALFSTEDDIAFCDSDILFFRPVSDLFTWPNALTGSLFMQDWQEAYALRPWQLSQHIILPRKLNSGLFFIKKKHYNLNSIESVLNKNYKVFNQLSCWIEQTCWAALAWNSVARFWSPKQIRVIRSPTDLNGKLAAGHFTSNVRRLLSNATNAMQMEGTPILIPTEPMRRLRGYQLFAEQTARFLQRKLIKPDANL